MTRRDPDEREEQQVEQLERVIATHFGEHRCERRDNTRPLRGSLAELKCGPAINRWGPLADSLVAQKQWRKEHHDADGIADPKMKPGLGKTAPGDNARSGVGSDKTARNEPRTDDRDDQKRDDVRAPANTGPKAGMAQHGGGTGIAGRNHE